MKFSCTLSLLLLGATASAAPSELVARGDPAIPPMTIVGQPDLTKTFTCGGKSYHGTDIQKAVQYGYALHAAKPQQTRGKKQYPHSFHNDDSKGHKLVFPAACPADKDRQEFPLMAGAPYNGGNSNQKQGDERVVFYTEDGEIAPNGHAQIYFCGAMTHQGAVSGGFVMCTL